MSEGDYRVADISLADFGRREIDIAEHEVRKRAISWTRAAHDNAVELQPPLHRICNGLGRVCFGFRAKAATHWVHSRLLRMHFVRLSLRTLRTLRAPKPPLREMQNAISHPPLPRLAEPFLRRHVPLESPYRCLGSCPAVRSSLASSRAPVCLDPCT